MKFIKKLKTCIEKILHIPTAGILFLIAVFFSVLIIQIFAAVVIDYVSNGFEMQHFLERIFLIFLFIEVVASIKIYFAEGYHFPLRFFVYIGITDLVRYTIINHEDPRNVLLNTISIFILILALAVLELKNSYLKKTSTVKTENDFDL
ncbi:phosphate-starvation-inducible protein PsiE [Candidatus Peregrinibacteria bacterium]|nr:phosphate-starvation-inducible protein PsiE [Candidatus Peregrinibacteria bacterium]